MSYLSCQRRIMYLLFILSVCFLWLVVRLFQVQVLKSSALSQEAVQQRLQSTVLLDNRGNIQARDERSLLDGRLEIGLLAFPGQYRGREAEIISSLTSIQGIEQINTPPHGMLPFWITPALNQKISPVFTSLPGLIPVSKMERYGPGALAAHVVGYLRESEGRGVSGLELAFDRELSMGQRTVLAAVVDGHSRLIPGIGYRIRRAEFYSSNVVTTIDLDLQRAVEQIMDRRIRQGAVVVLNPSNGDILAMASRPGFNAASLTVHLQQDQDSLINRALWEYQPGSIFKIVVAAAALEEDLVGLFDTFFCPGGVTVDGLYIPCSNLHHDQEITLVEAFAHSCNTAFIRLALELGPEKIYQYARSLGFGEVTGLPIGERAGYLPAVAEMAGARTQANTAIGQGPVQTTPLQVAAVMALIANGGREIQPRLVLALTDAYGREIRTFSPRRGQNVLSFSTVNKLKYLLQAVVAEGTGRPAGTTQAMLGAKTGTAQSGRLRDGREVLNHWIAGLYPLEKTRAAIVVFADDLREGTVSDVFGAIASYLEQQ
ncbi:MAG: penicillin-binding protein 2 [Bacillota bacterium]